MFLFGVGVSVVDVVACCGDRLFCFVFEIARYYLWCLGMVCLLFGRGFCYVFLVYALLVFFLGGFWCGCLVGVCVFVLVCCFVYVLCWF